MKKFIGLFLYAGVMFGLTAGLGFFMLKKATPHATDTESAEAEGEHGEASTDSHTANAGSHATDTHSSASEGGHATSAAAHESQGSPHKNDEQLPVAVRSTPMSVEEIVRMGLSLKSRDETVRKREAALREMETQQKLGIADIQAAQQEIEYLLAQASDQRAATEELLSRQKEQQLALESERQALTADRQKLKEEQTQLANARAEVESMKSAIDADKQNLALREKQLMTDKADFEKDRVEYRRDLQKFNNENSDIVAEKEKISSERKQLDEEKRRIKEQQEKLDSDIREHVAKYGQGTAEPIVLTPEEEAKNLKETGKMVDGMAPEKVAVLLQNLVNQGKEPLAINVLANMDPRKAAEVVDAITDEAFAAQLLEKYSERQQKPKAANR